MILQYARFSLRFSSIFSCFEVAGMTNIQIIFVCLLAATWAVFMSVALG